jgi:hypothetical protein
MAERGDTSKTGQNRNVLAVTRQQIAGALDAGVVPGVGVGVGFSLILGRLFQITGDGASVGFISLSLTMVLLVGSMMIVPLLVEASPKRTGSPLELVTSRWLAGMLFALAGAGASLLIYSSPIRHWFPAIGTAALTVTFGLSVGLLVECLIGDFDRLLLWVSVIALALLAPPVGRALSSLTGGLSIAEVRWMPTEALWRLFQYSLGLPQQDLGWSVVAVLAPTLGILAAVTFLAWHAGTGERMERPEESAGD